MAYRIEVGSKAELQLAQLDSAVAASVSTRSWLAQNAAVMVHRRLVGMPEDLAGLSKLRIRDWRILYWIYPAQQLIRIYRIQHRSEYIAIFEREGAKVSVSFTDHEPLFTLLAAGATPTPLSSFLPSPLSL